MIDAARKELAAANRVLVKHGVLDAYGHVSARNPEDPDSFLLSRNLAPGLVTADDVQHFTLDGETADPRPTYLERYIHSEIYRTRPDVMAVVHSHAPAILPFTIADQELRAVSHMAGFLAQGCPVFEIREVQGDGSDLLVRDKSAGAGLARVLGGAAVALMRGHGMVVVGTSVPQVVHRSVFTVLNAHTQAGALALGKSVTYLTPAEGRAAAESNDGQVKRAWELWRNELPTAPVG